MKQLSEQVAEKLKLDSKKMLTTEEAAKYMGIKKQTLYRMTMLRKIPYYKPGGGRKCLFRRDDLDRWMTSGRIEAIEKETFSEPKK